MNADNRVSYRRKDNAKASRFNGQKLAPYLFILPFLLSFVIFFSYPLVSAVIMSFQRVL
ncbi:arabinose transporter permease, partial [Paenibacillus sp. MCAF20]